ncbi:hypothetical protein FGB62_106g02 [Gracilaria domingensis]|nr:hypothetical protein FGB62_106g02 [Gracilaria domingensis]
MVKLLPHTDAAAKQFQEIVNYRENGTVSERWLNWNQNSRNATERAMKMFDDACTTTILHGSVSDSSEMKLHPLGFAITSSAVTHVSWEATVKETKTVYGERGLALEVERMTNLED